MKHNITWSLHERKYELLTHLVDEGVELSDIAKEKLVYALYELDLGLEIDTETGEVKVSLT